MLEADRRGRVRVGRSRERQLDGLVDERGERSDQLDGASERCLFGDGRVSASGCVTYDFLVAE